MAKVGGVDGLIRELRVAPGDRPGLDHRATDDKLGLEGKDTAQAQVEEFERELGELHNRLWAEAARSVLLVLQGMDAAGKDSTIRRVLSGLNPQGCKVASFKAPSDAEQAQDYLWRVHAACPPRGELGVFNRSHYEDVIAARFVGAATHEQCRSRYRHLREFERMLTEEGTTIVKVFLHLSKDEQRLRLQARLDDPTKSWKFKPGDLDVRKRWEEYQAVYEEVITETSTDAAPWYVVPADRNWVRDFAIAALLAETFRRLDPQFPPLNPDFKGLVVE
jgi:PPK2 family polyphosphate:nucleotide phosphotransferase